MVDSVSANELDSIDDEDLLRSMLDKSEDFELRRQIRSRLRAINRTKQPVSEVDTDSSKTARRQQQQQQVPARVHQPKETRAAATSSSASKNSDETDGRRTNQRQPQTRPANVTSTTTEKETVVLRSIEPSLKSNKPKEFAKSGLQENVSLRKVGEVKSSSPASGTSDYTKSEFLEGKNLRRVEEVKSTNEISRRPTGQQKSDFVETVTLRKVEGIKMSGSGGDSTAVRRPVRNLTPKMAREHFKGMDAATGGRGCEETTVNRNSYMSNIRQAMLDWCRYRVAGYENVDITDFSGSWSNGIAFCALVHSFFPDAFDFDELDPNAKRHNLQLAFTTAEQRGGVYPLLDVDDMIQAGSNQDWKSIFTYVNSIYSDLASDKKKPSLDLKADDKASADNGANNDGDGVVHGSGDVYEDE